MNVGLNMGQSVSFDKTDDDRSLFCKQLFILKKKLYKSEENFLDSEIITTMSSLLLCVIGHDFVIYSCTCMLGYSV